MPYKEFNPEVLYADSEIVFVSKEQMESLKRIGMLNERKRIRLCCHKDIDDPLHEMLLVHTRNTYVQPHRHLYNSESLHVIEGNADLVFFHENGEIRDVVRLGPYASGQKFYYRLAASYFHTFVIQSEFFLYHETTKGPFKRSDTIFASWAPDGSNLTESQTYLGRLRETVELFLKSSVTK